MAVLRAGAAGERGGLSWRLWYITGVMPSFSTVPNPLPSESDGNETFHLSWEETYCAMAAESEDWSDFDVAVGDGVDAA